ncbi:winged helix-turn-helix domain-containing protein [Flagellimonas myxillae]|uniref:winged helix-turn-helix domain-containing protein n=1 Tax=Flagellimonas myxillae TaxID=2942214 RepID=UPI00201F7A9B|nr:winged helix-turn-helix domain-containing protein [Muricauda myxillae]MCL6266744.1 winged helix-turn-helix domain-containing protein [Muricauda myxillae]
MKIIIYVYSALFLAVLSYVVLDNMPEPPKENLSSRIKVALRNTGNTLLLQNKDSTSLVMPIIALKPNHFELTFQSELPIIPDSLVASVEKNFYALNLPKDYLVEVVECNTKQVSYSYARFNDEEQNIVHCMARKLPQNCYTINVQFPNISAPQESNMGTSLYALLLVGSIGIGLLFWAKQKETSPSYDPEAYSTIGNYFFYKDQNRLVRDGASIKLTSKEAELIKIFSDHLNQVVTRDMLLNEVWESKGVFVSRSLDTFISKIRKKFQDDDRVNLINVHGVGYKLEISKKSRS